MAKKETRPSLDEYFMRITHTVKERSTCNRGKVGAIVVKGSRIITTGYSGAPKGLKHCTDVGCHISKIGHEIEGGDLQDHCTRTVHAEQNAIIQASLFGVSIDGATIYCTHFPCYNCAKMLINAGIQEIVYDEGYPDKLSESILDDCKILVRKYSLKK